MTVDQILLKLFQGIDRSIEIIQTQKDTPEAGEYIFTVRNYKWTRVGKVITSDSGDEFLVNELGVDNNGKHLIYATKISQSVNDPISLLAEDPKYWEGFIRMVQPEVEMLRDSSEKTPMVYVSNIGDTSFNEKINRIRSETSVTIYFLDQANFSDWTSNEYYSKVTDSMIKLANGFVDSIRKQKHIIDFDNDMDYKQVKKFASIDSEGHLKKYFNDDLSGVGLTLNLKVINSVNCKDPYAFRV